MNNQSIGIVDSHGEEIKTGDFIREVGEYADSRKFQVVPLIKITVQNEDGHYVTNFPVTPENLKYYEIVK